MRSSRRRRVPAGLRRAEVVLAARISYPREERLSQRASSVEDDSDLQQLRLEVEEVLHRQLPADLAELYGLDVEIEIRGHRYGSLVVFFTAILVGLGWLASYKDLYDSVQLIREHAEFLLERLVGRRYPGWKLTTGVEVKRPRLSEPFESWWTKRMGRQLFPEQLGVLALAGEGSSSGRSPRDGFFWFLLVLCVVLLVVVGLLVYGAVVQTYFPAPPLPPAPG